jgi:hypothetical protein
MLSARRLIRGVTLALPLLALLVVTIGPVVADGVPTVWPT